MLNQSDLAEVNEFWAKEFNCSIDELQDNREILSIKETADQSVHILLKDNRYYITAPATYLPAIKEQFQHNSSIDIIEILNRIIVDKFQYMVGPAYIGYINKAAFTPTSSSAFILAKDDTQLLDTLKQEVTETEWDHGAVEYHHQPIFVCVEDSKVVAATSFEIWNNRIAHIGVITNGKYRNKGYGRQVVSAITQYCFDNELVPQYRTLRSNVTSISIANRLGYQEYGATVFYRLKS